jgi:hypothetical protein
LNGKREKAGHWGAALSLVLIRDLSEPISRFDWSRKSGREGLLNSNTAGATLAVGGGKILTYGNHSVAGTPGSGFTGSAALQIAVRIGAGQAQGGPAQCWLGLAVAVLTRQSVCATLEHKFD